MNVGDSIEIASGVIHYTGTKWRAKMVMTEWGPQFDVSAYLYDDEWVELCDMDGDFDATELAQLCDDIACALAAELAKAKGIEVKP
jgi:hypothetical protein